jgi:hypothetical protein
MRILAIVVVLANTADDICRYVSMRLNTGCVVDLFRACGDDDILKCKIEQIQKTILGWLSCLCGNVEKNGGEQLGKGIYISRKTA